MSATPRDPVFLRPVGSPLPLGLVALAGATMTLSALQLGWVAASEQKQVALVILVVAPVPQLITSIFGLLARDTVVGAGMGWLTATWLAYALVMLSTPAGAATGALGAYLLVAAAAFIVIVGGVGASKGWPALVMGTAGVRFAVSGIFELTGSSGWERAAGWVGVWLCVLALVAATAIAISERRLTAVEQEPGVRREL